MAWNLESLVRRTLPAALLLIIILQPSGAWAAHAPGDPWESFNRRVFAFNMKVDKWLIRPLARFTSGLTPGPIGKAVHNFVVNLNEPVVIVNDLLQVKPGRALKATIRLAVNTTAGGLGAIDVAKAMNLPNEINGFGDTLGRWGVGPGPYVVVPVMGPFNLRDLFGTVVDDATLPFQSVNYPYRTEVDITLNIVGGLNEREEVNTDYDTLLNGAADPYASLRSAYQQSREAHIRGENALPTLPDIDEPPTPPTASGTVPTAVDAPPPPAAPQAVEPGSAEPAPAADAPPKSDPRHGG